MRVSGATVVVTGASSGIGAATAVAFARAGARALVLLARTRPALEEVAARVGAAGARAVVLPVDLRDAAAVDRAARDAIGALGAPDVLVNNAGAGRWLFAEETSAEELRQMMDVPFAAAFHATRAFLPGMLARRSGRIVNVNSPASFVPWPGATGYAAARWALRGLSEALRADLGGTGVGVTLFTAGQVDTPYFEHNPGTLERMPRIARLYRTLTPDEAARAIVRAVERDARNAAAPPLLAATLAVHRFFPGLVGWLVARTGVRHRASR
jgi:NADP-dependent 3-hydroxy acid dehydrogenase YdfG